MKEHNSQHNNLSREITQAQIKMERNLPQKIKELVMAQPEHIDSISDDVVKQEVKKLRKFVREEGVEI